MIAAALLLASLVTVAPVAPVTSLAALQTAIDAAKPGDRIELADGVYTSAKAITIRKSGITVAAANVGKAEIRGSAGFVFAGGASDVVLTGFTLRHKGRLAVPADSHRVRITRNNLEIDVPVLPDDAGGWVEVSGDDAEVDHNTFQNRTNEGVYVHISGPGANGMAKRSWVHHNYFYNHKFNGGNGGESVRIGNSWRQKGSANTVLEHNLFEKANGDSEAISVKSSDNVVRYNTMRDSRGFLVLRHGDRSVVEGNILFNTGIRFHGNDHRIINNYVENTRDRAMVFGSGKEADSGPTSKLHDRPDRVTVAFNTLLGKGPVVDSDGGAFKPKDCVLANNVIQGTGSLTSMHSGSTVRYEGNIVWGGSAGAIPSGGYRSVDPRLGRDANGLLRLSSGSPAIDASSGSFPYVTNDFDPHARSGRLDVGADEFGGAVFRKALTTADVGPLAP